MVRVLWIAARNSSLMVRVLWIAERNSSFIRRVLWIALCYGSLSKIAVRLNLRCDRPDRSVT